MFSEVIVIVARGPALLLLLALMIALTPGIPAQQVTSPPQAAQLPHAPGESDDDEAGRRLQHDQQKKANQERFQKLKEDTEKLVVLSNQLKEYVGKANENTLSLDVVKKAEEIERLAKSVKDKMRAN